MGIGAYIRHIGRKHGGGRDLSREQAADLMGQVVDGSASDFEIGAFCIAMRIKGETADEFAGFLDAIYPRLARISSSDDAPIVVIPSYNGARKYPVLTPLLGLLLARQGISVLMHGMATESVRITSQDVLAELGIMPATELKPLEKGTLTFVPTDMLCPGLARLLSVRRFMTLRNSGHSLAKMITPIAGRSLVCSSYTHGEYTDPMTGAFAAHGTSALLFHGLEGEVIAEERRLGETLFLHDGSPVSLPEIRDADADAARGLDLDDPGALTSAVATAHFTRTVLDGQEPVPASIAAQAALITSALAML